MLQGSDTTSSMNLMTFYTNPGETKPKRSKTMERGDSLLHHSMHTLELAPNAPSHPMGLAPSLVGSGPAMGQSTSDAAPSLELDWIPARHQVQEDSHQHLGL